MSILLLMTSEPRDLDKIREFLSQHLFSLAGRKIDWSLTDARGRTAFDIARALNDLALLQLLLDFDLPIPEYYDPSGLSAEVLTLLETRGAWQRESQSGAGGIYFNCAAAWIDRAASEMNAETTVEEAVLLFGKTGHGKSTLCNYHADVHYRRQGKGIVLAKDSPPEVTHRGNGITSTTLSPAVVTVPAKRWQLVDLAGVGDTRSLELEICAAVMLCLFMAHVKKIKGVSLVCTASSLDDTMLLQYRECATKVGRILLKNPLLAQHMLLVITKVDPAITQEDYRADLLEKLRALWDAEHLESVSEDVRSDDRVDLLALKRVTEILLQDTQAWRIIRVDVTEPESRIVLERAIEALPLADQIEFNFSNYHALVQRYVAIVMSFLEKQTQLQLRVVEQKKIMDEQQQHVDFWRNSEHILTGESTIEQRIVDADRERQTLESQLKKVKGDIDVLDAQQSRIASRLIVLLRQQAIIQSAPHHEEAALEHQTLSQSWQEVHDENQLVQSRLQDTLKDLNAALITCKKLQKVLRKEKVDIETIHKQAGEGVEEQLALAMKTYADANIKWENAVRQLSVNDAFFKRVNQLSKFLNRGKVSEPALKYPSTSVSASGFFDKKVRSNSSDLSAGDIKRLSELFGKLMRQMNSVDAQTAYAIKQSREEFHSTSRVADAFNAQVSDYGFVIEDGPGAGDCFFDAMADQLRERGIDRDATSEALRIQAASFMFAHQDEFRPFIEALSERSPEEYIQRAYESGEWADDPMMNALVRALNCVRLVIVRSDGAHPTIIPEVSEADDRPKVYLGYYVGLHYVSLRGEPSLAMNDEIARYERRVVGCGK